MFGLELDLGLSILLILSLLAACAFEFINGFHDTANAVATVIYTRSLKPRTAVVWSGIWNFIGVNVGGITVAMSIVNLLPTEILVDKNVYHSIAMIFSLILTAIIWNLGTWYFGIPCSSSHTLIGSIFGVGMAYMFITPEGTINLNWDKVVDMGLSLLISPFFGFSFAILLMLIFLKTIKKKKFFVQPDTLKKTPFWIRLTLIFTCTGISFSHGSNDGQKGIGLVMIILISILPTYYAIDTQKNPTNMIGNLTQIETYMHRLDSLSLVNNVNVKTKENIASINANIDTLKGIISMSSGVNGVPKESRFETRKCIISISKQTDKLIKSDENLFTGSILSEKETKHLKSNVKELNSYTEFAPWWVVLMISLSLGIGTMVGWKRIVVTIGEKIGKSHLSYAQGASAEIVGASTIIASTYLGLPVSTTHVLSSGIAGSMVATGGKKNLQYGTIKNIAIAWIVTIPVTILLSAGLFLFFRLFVK